MLYQKITQAAAHKLDLQKALEKLIFGFIGRHISHRKCTEAIFSKNKHFIKTHELKLRNSLF